MNHKILPSIALSGAVLGAQACATTPHSQQFQEARNTYQQASNGKAAELTPDELLRAENLLEEAAAQDNGSSDEVHLAYLAQRQAQIAQSHAQRRAMKTQLAEMEERRVALQEQARKRAEQRAQSYEERYEETQERYEETRQTKEELAQQLEELRREKQKLQNELNDMSGQLEGLAEVVRKKDELVLTISGSVLFETNESELMSAAKKKLERVASVLQDRDGWKKVVVVGHTDSRGPEDYNQKLSQERARSVRQYLVDKGMDASAIAAEGEGEGDPIATNETPAGRARNRRVELRIKDREKASEGSQYGALD